jgi:hypothetical protein
MGSPGSWGPWDPVGKLVCDRDEYLTAREASVHVFGICSAKTTASQDPVRGSPLLLCGERG